MRAVLSKVFVETHDVRRFVFKVDSPLNHRPGQFVTLQIPGFDVKRAYSVASSPLQRGFFELIVKLVPGGRLTPRLFELSEGSVVEVKGPFGKFFFDVEQDERLPVVLIGGGTGIAPLRSILHYIVDVGLVLPVYFWFAFRSEDDVILDDEFSSLASNHLFFKYYKVLSHPNPEWDGYAGHVTESLIASGVPDLRDAHYYLCGPPAMVAVLVESLEGFGVPREHLHYEKF